MTPPEILDGILEHIPTNKEGRSTLVACALVATWWTGPSQRRLFSSVPLNDGNHQRWMNGIVLPGSKTDLLRYIHSILHSFFPLHGTWYPVRSLPKDSGQYLPALCNLRSLSLYNAYIEHLSEVEFRTCFSAFRETLTGLAIGFFSTSFSAFVALVNYFPNITTLRLGSFSLRPDEEPVPLLSRPLRGKIYIRYTNQDQH